MKKRSFFIGILIVLLSFQLTFAQTLYRYQIGYFNSETNKLKAIERINNIGLNAYSMNNTVYMGDYEDKNEIKKYRNKIIELGYNPYLKSYNRTGDIKENENLKKDNPGNKNIYPLDDDFTLQGVFGTTTFFFEKSDYWDINYNNSYVVIDFDQSGIREFDYSMITILVNDIPVKSENLYNFRETEGSIKIKLRKDILVDGFNSVKITLFHRITDDDCYDDINTANWFVIKKSSYIHLEYDYLKDKNSISSFPYPFILKNDKSNINCAIGLPNNPTNEEIKYAIELNSYLSSLVPFENIKIPIKKYEEIKNNENAIIIMNDESFNKLKKSKVNKENGYLLKENNNESKRLYITGNLKRSFYALIDKDFVKQMKSNKQIVDFDVANELENNIFDDSKITFADLGFTNINLEGMFYKKARYTFEIPNSWDLKEGSKIHLKLRYPEFMDLEKSDVSVFINGDPIASKRLEREKALLDILEFDIPRYYFDEKFINLEVRFFLAMDDYNCKESLNSKAYSSILSDSYLELPHEYKDISFFEDYPNPFVKDGSFNKLNLVMEKNDDFSKINMYSYIISAMTPFNLNYFELDIVNDIKNKDSNYILISSPDKDNLIKEYNNNLNIKFSEDFKHFVSDEKAKVIINEANTVLAMQIKKSHLNKDKSILYITSTDSSYLDYIYELTNEENLNPMQGDVILLSDDGIVDSFYYDKKIEEEKEVERSNQQRSKQFRISGRTMAILITLFIFFVVISLILLYRIIGYRRKK
ncbi:cellulose biosynthesis cyclic di-GMP-binding regulatory protein BcsB [Peptostreptococcaceae bacterium AGR-M142]